MDSSYKKNNYGSIFRALILSHKPVSVVECGVLDGYSAFYIANALRFNRNKRGINSRFYAYDIFEKYQYKHGRYDDLKYMLILNKLDANCCLIKCDAFEAAVAHQNSSVDFLHMDISNDGDILLKTLEIWGPKISKNGIIAFEGGSEERDNGWIKTYNKKPIRPELINNSIVYNNWDIQIFHEYPSMTLMWRK